MPTPRRSEIPSAPLAHTEPSPARNRVRDGFIVLALLFQIVVPLRYYLGGRGYDERFSWRMFSTLRLRACKVRVIEYVQDGSRSVGRNVSVERDVHLAWLRLLERLRGPVIDAYLERRCTLIDAQRVAFDARCDDTDSRALPPVHRTLECNTHRFSDEASP